VRAADGLRARFGQAEMLDLALGDKFLDCARHVLDRHFGIDAMLVEQVDRVDAQPLQRRVADLSDVLGSVIHAGLLARLWINREAEFGGDHHLVSYGLQGLTDNLLVGEGAVDLGGVEEGDAPIHRLADQRDALLLGQRVTVAEVQPHAAEADGRDFQIAFSKFALLHL
jgi:hypothetical protein